MAILTEPGPGQTIVFEGENTAEARRQAAIASAAVAQIASAAADAAELAAATAAADAVSEALAAAASAEASALSATASAASADLAALSAAYAALALDLTRLSLYGDPLDKDASLIIDFDPPPYLGRDNGTFGRQLIMARQNTAMGPVLVAKEFAQLISFTRTSAATYVNSAGNIVTTPASKNLLTFTEEFDDAAWTKTSATITANSLAAPDGLMTADTLTAASGSGITPLLNQTGTTVASTIYTASIFVRPGTHTFVQMLIGNQSADWCNFTLTGNGSVQNNGAAVGAISFDSATGYYRISMTYTAGGTDRRTAIALVPSGTATRAQTGTYAGTETVHLWGAQLETGSTATSYVRNFGGLFPPRFDYDPVTLQPRGPLIEEQRTNLLLRSEEFDNASWSKSGATVTANAATSPDGTADADKLVEDTGNSQHFVAEPFSITSGTTYTFSVYAKAAERTVINLFGSGNLGGTAVRVNLTNGSVQAGSATVTPAGGGFYRISYTLTATATGSGSVYIALYNVSGTYPGDGTSGIFIWGAQLEAGSFATSYIPTVASQVTRTADRASIVAPNFAPWYNQSEGTFVVEADSTINPTVLSVFRAAAVSDGTTGNAVSLFTYNAKWGGSVTVGGANQCDLQQSWSYTANVPAKVAMAYKADDFAVSVNGLTALTDTSGSIPTVDRLSIGSINSSGPLNGHIRRIAYYPSRLSNAQLQALSA